jgi:hypothetical protein
MKMKIESKWHEISAASKYENIEINGNENNGVMKMKETSNEMALAARWRVAQCVKSENQRNNHVKWRNGEIESGMA